MPLAAQPRIAVVLPGTGSDADFARRAFEPALRAAGIDVIAVEPDPRRVVASYLEALDAAAAEHGRILVGGVSIGAAVALNWAIDQQDRTDGVLAALPAWTGDPDGAPAAASAAFTAQRLREDGLHVVSDEMRASSPSWLGAELTKSWTSQWPDLPLALDEASVYRGPTAATLATLQVPVGICGAVDDPVHPIAVAQLWADLLPDAALGLVTLAQIGADPGVLGRSALDALVSAGVELPAGSR